MRKQRILQLKVSKTAAEKRSSTRQKVHKEKLIDIAEHFYPKALFGPLINKCFSISQSEKKKTPEELWKSLSFQLTSEITSRGNVR